MAAILLALPGAVSAHVIPDDVAIQAFVKPEGHRLHLLVRVPFNALADIIFPSLEGGELDLPQVDPMLPRAATTWISDWVDLYEDGMLLPKPRVVETRVSLPSDNSFHSYQEAWEHVTGPALPASVKIFPDQPVLDVLFDYPIRSDRSSFAIHSRLARLGGMVVTGLRFLAPDGAIRAYGFTGDPGLFDLDPRWGQAVQRFLPLGFFEVIQGSDYLLFLFCAALLFRNLRALLPFGVTFTLAHSITLIAAAYGLAPDALWFPVLFETLIAISIVYLAFENILGGTPPRGRWAMAFGFGLVYGFGFSFTLRQRLAFGGSHPLASILSFNIGVELALALLVLVSIPLLNVLFRFAVPERVGTIFLAALAAHTGWHRMLDRAQWLSSSGLTFGALVPAVTLRWLGFSLLLASALYVARAALRPRISGTR